METYKKDGISISYYVKGTGQSVMLLHGFPDSSAIWQSQADELASKNFRVVVPDARGFGHSSKPADKDQYRLKLLSEDMFGLLDHMNIDKVILVGHDWGGFLAWYMVGKCPERILKMAVLSVGHSMSFFAAGGLEQRQKSWYMLLFQDPQAEDLLTANDWALWKNLMGESGNNVEYASSQISQMSKEGALTAGLNWYRANIQLNMLAMTQAPPQPKINVPILGLWSTGDKFLTESQMTASKQYVADGLFEYKRIEGASHWMQIDAANAVNEALLSFFQQNASSL